MGTIASKSLTMYKESSNRIQQWLSKYHSIDEIDEVDSNNTTIENGPSGVVRDIPSPTFTAQTYVIAKHVTCPLEDASNAIVMQEPSKHRPPLSDALNPIATTSMRQQSHASPIEHRNEHIALVRANLSAEVYPNIRANLPIVEANDSDDLVSVIYSRISKRGKRNKFLTNNKHISNYFR